MTWRVSLRFPPEKRPNFGLYSAQRKSGLSVTRLVRILRKRRGDGPSGRLTLSCRNGRSQVLPLVTRVPLRNALTSRGLARPQHSNSIHLRRQYPPTAKTKIAPDTAFVHPESGGNRCAQPPGYGLRTLRVQKLCRPILPAARRRSPPAWRLQPQDRQRQNQNCSPRPVLGEMGRG